MQGKSGSGQTFGGRNKARQAFGEQNSPRNNIGNSPGNSIGNSPRNNIGSLSWNLSAGLGDFYTYVREPRPHRWTSWGLAIVLTGLVFTIFSQKLISYQPPKAQIVYFESWRLDRSAAEIHADRIERIKAVTRRNAKRRAEYQRLANRLGIAYDSTLADAVTRETLGAEADALAKPVKPAQPPRQSDLAHRAARKPETAPEKTSPAKTR